jgi:lipid A 3-O-deacylase
MRKMWQTAVLLFINHVRSRSRKAIPIMIITGCIAGPGNSRILYAQPDTTSPRMLEQISFRFDDDYFSIMGVGSDKLYTSGLQLGWGFRNYGKKDLLTALFIPVKNETVSQTTLNIYHHLYTPENLGTTEIQNNDRPYAAEFYLGLGYISWNNIRKEKINSELTLGVMGPIAFGRETQIAIHKLIHNRIPNGWHNQITNDLIFNYRITLEKAILSPSDKLELNGIMEVNAGLHMSNIRGGLLIRAGVFDDYFYPGIRNYQEPFHFAKSQPPQAQIYLYTKPIVTGVLENSTLTGGLISRHSPHTIPRALLNRVVFRIESGLALSLRNLNFSYSENFISAEYKGGNSYRFGSMSLVIGLPRKRNSGNVSGFQAKK